MKKIKLNPGSLISEEKGSVIIIVALIITVLLSVTALVVDLGFVYFERARLVTAAEASALAGASSFPYRDDGEYKESDYDYAIEEAERVAEINGLEDYEINLYPEDEGQKEEIEVIAKREVGYSFARVMGFYEQEVTGLAAAEAVPIAGYVGVIPMGIPEDEFEGYGTHELKVGAQDTDEGNYQALALGREEEDYDYEEEETYEENLVNGYEKMLRIGDMIYPEPGNMPEETIDGLEKRYESGDIEIIVPIVSHLSTGRSDKVEILGFSSFILEEIDEPQGTGHTVIKGTFQEKVGDGEIASETKDYGLRGTRLVR